MEARRIYLRSIDTRGRASLTEHWCWDADLFVSLRQSEVRKQNSSAAKKGPTQAKIETIGEDEWRRLMWPKQ